MVQAGRELAAVLWALWTYATSVLPRVRREQRRWSNRAEAIRDPRVRTAALAALHEKAANVEATAVFAILAPRRARGAVIRAGAALQIAIDYLDTVEERSEDRSVADGLRRQGTLARAFSPVGEAASSTAGSDEASDAYLWELLLACRRATFELPSRLRCEVALRRSIARCGEGQAYTHAAAEASAELRAWAERESTSEDYEWWEVAAGASSSVATHALLALAAEPRIGAAEPDLIGAAYFPPIGALTVLLDDLIDRAQDAAVGQHNYIGYYSGPDLAAERLDQIARRAKDAISPLRHRDRHRAILAGVVGFYLSAPTARAPYCEPTRTRLLESFGTSGRVLTAAAALLRRL